MNTYSTKDIIAQSYINIDFPAQYIATMNTNGLSNVGISDFYNAFCAKNHITTVKGKNVLFQPALILGYLYTTFLLPHQSFFSSIEDEKIDPEEWGIVIEKDTNCSIKNISRRIRNSLAHNHVIIEKIWVLYSGMPIQKSKISPMLK